MASESIDFVTKFWESFKKIGPFLSLSFALLFFLVVWLAYIEFPYLKSISDETLGIFIVVGLIFLVLFFGAIERRMKARSARKRILSHLDTLNPKEKVILSYLLGQNQRSFSVEMTNETASSLHSKGLVSRGSGNVLILPHIIRDFVWKELQKRQEEFAWQGSYEDYFDEMAGHEDFEFR